MKALTWRDWRWTWLWFLLRWSLTAVLIIPGIVLYLPALLIVAAFDALGDWAGSVHVRWWNRDLARKRGMAVRAGEARPDGWLP